MKRAVAIVALSLCMSACAAPARFSDLPASYRAGISGTPEVKSTAKGVTYFDVRQGSGELTAAPGLRAVVEYTAMLEDGMEVDTSKGSAPLNFRIGSGRVVPGLEDGMAGMKVNGKRRLIIPARLAYGKKGVPGTIPPDSTLIMDVDLLALQH